MLICLYATMLTPPQSLIFFLPVLRHLIPHLYHTASLFPSFPKLNSYGVLGSVSLKQMSVMHQSQGNEGSTSAALRKASGEKKLISSAGSQPRGVPCGD